MKILIISGSFYPVNSPRSFRATELAKEFARQGHQTKVVFPDRSLDYSDWHDKYPTLTIAPTKDIKWGNIRLNGKKLIHWMLRITKRLLQLLMEYPSIEWYIKMPKILKKEKGYDFLISIAVPHPIHWGVARCVKKRKDLTKTWIADCGDPFMGEQTDSFRHPFYFAYLEKNFCRRVDFLTIPTESAREGYYRTFHQKIQVIPQGFNFEEVKLEEYKPNKPISFCYAGGFIPGRRDPRPILDILLKMNMDFRFYIYTNQRELLVEYIDRFKEKLIIHGYIPRLELIRRMSTVDFLLNIENGTSVQIPSKLIDYSLSKRPILSLNSQNINKQKLDAFLTRDYSQQTIIGNIESYNIRNVINSFLTLK